MRQVWKYKITPEDNQVIHLPAAAEILSVQTQNGSPELWCLCNPEETKCDTRRFRLAGTGHPIVEDNLVFIGTFQLDMGSLVFHLFEVK
jgi:hypothetical protein